MHGLCWKFMFCLAFKPIHLKVHYCTLFINVGSQYVFQKKQFHSQEWWRFSVTESLGYMINQGRSHVAIHGLGGLSPPPKQRYSPTKKWSPFALLGLGFKTSCSISHYLGYCYLIDRFNFNIIFDRNSLLQAKFVFRFEKLRPKLQPKLAPPKQKS